VIRSLKKLSELLDKHSKIQFVYLFVLLLGKSFLDGFGLGLIAPYIAAVVDSSVVFDHEVFKKINLFTKIDSSEQLIYWLSIVLISVFISKNLFGLFVTYYQSRLVFAGRSYQGKKLLEAYMNAPYSYHLEHNTAELDRNLRFESIHVYAFVQQFLLLCSNIFLTITIFIVLIITNWQAVVSIGFFIVVFSALFILFSGKYNKIFGIEAQESQLRIGQTISEGLSSIIEVKLHQIESFFPDRLFKHMMSNARANWRQATLTSAPTLFLEIIAVGTLVGAIIVFSNRNIDFNTVLPLLGLFSFAFIRLIPTVTAIIRSLQSIKFLVPSVDVVHADFQNLGRLTNQAKHIQKPINESIAFNNLLIKDITFSFPNNKQVSVINGLSLHISKGQAIGITGPSGSGKTTLINLLLGLLKQKSGKIDFNGEALQHNLMRWRSLIGYVPQSITLIDSNIRENVALGIEGDNINDEKVWSTLKEANLDEFVKDLPEQLGTFIGENGKLLSGGQKQRLGLARALYRNPEVIIFDEATSALDVKTEKKITKEIMKLSGKRTLIIVAHRISTIKDCDVIFYLKNGKIVNSGRFEELKELNED
jgi:ATP-binding cassette, subfamily B, bacterial PglK